jgi:TonB family protein
MRLTSRLWFMFLLLPPAISSAQDVQVREKAVELLEHANSISTPHEFSGYDQVIVFQSFSPAGTKSGQFTSVVQGPRSYRDEYKFGNYDLLVVVNGSTIADVGDRTKAPREVRRMTLLNHPYTARFDRSDIIRSIRSRQVNGRSAHCIEFDTVAGEKSDTNEICIDSQLGIVLRAHVNDETITNSDFFAYRDTYLPRRITYEQGDLRMELEQVKKEIEGPFDPDFLTPPLNAVVAKVCTTVRRPFGQVMTQPKPGSGSDKVDVMLHGTIRTDGRIRSISIDRSDRPDLNQEAIKLFSTWKFSPAICDGAAMEVPLDVTLHFQGR